MPDPTVSTLTRCNPQFNIFNSKPITGAFQQLKLKRCLRPLYRHTGGYNMALWQCIWGNNRTLCMIYYWSVYTKHTNTRTHAHTLSLSLSLSRTCRVKTGLRYYLLWLLELILENMYVLKQETWSGDNGGGSFTHRIFILQKSTRISFRI